MKRALIVAAIIAFGIVFLVIVVRFRIEELKANSAAPSTDAPEAPAAADAARIQPGYIYGRVVTNDGATYEGRLRWGGDQEASWGDYFNGTKVDNPWLASVPPGKLPTVPDSIRVFGLVLVQREVPIDTDRLFMARFGDIVRIDAQGRDVRVTMKSGTAFNLNRMDASDFDDGVRVWDARHGEVNLDSSVVRAIELLPAGPSGAAPSRRPVAGRRLHHPVRPDRLDRSGRKRGGRHPTCAGDPSPRPRVCRGSGPRRRVRRIEGSTSP